jgi:acetoacetyl-CoA synthetase
VLRAGAGRPVFLVADAWGQLNLYAGLVERLGTDRPVHGVRVPLRAADGRARRIEEVAVDAGARIREVQAEGPYTLAGYSFGGLVAYETARLLREAGQEVAWLGLLDVRPPAAALSRRETAALRRSARWRALRTHGPAALAAAVTRRVRASVVPEPAATTPAAPEDAELRFFTASEVVAEAYRPGRFDGTVTFFLADGSRPAAGTTLPAWRRVAAAVHVVDVPGHHGDLDDERIGMLSGQHVAALATAVTETLR